MSTSTVNVKYVNPPKEGKEWWSIKDDGGVSYWRKAPIPAHLQGKSCEIAFDIGKDDFRKLVSIKAAGAAQETRINNHNGNGHHKNDEDIAVLALVKSFIEAGKIQDVANVSRALKVLRDQWREYKNEGAPQTPKQLKRGEAEILPDPDPGFDDETPGWGADDAR